MDGWGKGGLVQYGWMDGVRSRWMGGVRVDWCGTGGCVV